MRDRDIGFFGVRDIILIFLFSKEKYFHNIYVSEY